MYNRVNQVLEQYPFVVNQTYKGRGALICETDQGLKILKEYRGSEARADFLYKILFFLREHGQQRVDCIVKTKEERTVAVDSDETLYIVRDWYEGRECDAASREDILRGIRQLAGLHLILKNYEEEIPEYLQASEMALGNEYERHFRELKKVKNYINSKKKKNDFEREFVKHCQMFLEQAEEVIELQQAEALRIMDDQMLKAGMYGICHGDFNHHNIIFSREGATILNYDKAMYDIQVGDLSNFMRKILEKHNWSMGLGKDMMSAYERIRPLSASEIKQLYIRLAYPEKFWKISNHYYNTSKAWVCGRDLEKLNKEIRQNEEKTRFLSILCAQAEIV